MSVAPVVTEGLESLYGVDDPTCNNVEVQIQRVGGPVLKRVYACGLLLMMHSPRFKAQLDSGWQGTAAAAGSEAFSQPGLSPPARAHGLQRELLVRVSVDDEAEVGAVEECLRFMYGGKMPEALPLAQLLAAYRMADYLDMQSACKGCVAQITAPSPASTSIEDALLIAYGADESLPEHLRVDELKAFSLSALLHHLGDVAGTMRSDALRAQWRGLPHGALLALLASDALATDSEDSVLAALSLWADDNEVSDEDARALLGHVRLLQLSNAFFFTVLPQLYWVAQADAITCEELMRLAGYAMTDELGKRVFEGSMGAKPPPIPKAWLTVAPRPKPAGYSSRGSSVHTFVFTRAQLLEALPQLQGPHAGAAEPKVVKLYAAPPYFAHGLDLVPSVALSSNDALGVHLAAHLLPSSMEAAWLVWRTDFCVTLLRPGNLVKLQRAADQGCVDGLGVGWPDLFTFPRAQPISDIASWDALLLADGALRVELAVGATKDTLLTPARMPARGPCTW